MFLKQLCCKVVRVMAFGTLLGAPGCSNEIGGEDTDTIRLKVSDTVAFAAPARATISEFYQAHDRMPMNAQEAGFSTDTGYSKYVERITIVARTDRKIVIRVVVTNLGGDIEAGEFFHWEGTGTDFGVRWRCTPVEGQIERRYLPRDCQG